MSEVIVNLGANTSQATAAVEELNDDIKSLGKSTEKVNTDQKQLEATLKKQEATIKTIDGAINLLGGSVELLASGLVLSGAATEEQAKEFEAAAIGAIAFADGAKRTFDGLKSLNEGLAESGGLVKTLQTQFTKLFAVVKANPFVALATVLAGVAVAYESIRSEQEKNARISKEELDINNELNKVRKESIDPLDRSLEVLTDSVEQRGLEVKAIEDLKKAYPGFEAFLTRENQLTQQGIEFLKAKIGIRKDEAALALIAQKQVEAEVKLEERLAEITREFGFTQQAANARKKARDEFAQSTEVLNAKETELIDSVNKQYEAVQRLQPVLDAQVKASKDNFEAVKVETTQILSYVDAVNARNKAIKEGIEGFIEGIGGAAKQTEGVIQRALPTELPALEKIPLTFAEKLRKVSGDLNDFFESETGKAISQGLSIASNFTNLLLQAQDDSTEESFEASKKYKIAQVVTSAAQSAFEAFASAQKLNGVVPGLGTALGLALVGAIGVASNKAIQDIQNSTFNSPGSVSTPSAGATPSFSSQATPNLGGGFVTGVGVPSVSTPVAPIRAYVVTGDIVNGIQANGQIQRRRTLGPG